MKEVFSEDTFFTTAWVSVFWETELEVQME